MRIQKIEAENFKLFTTRFQDIKQIDNADMILFNGPNGYGKTSVFDILEFCLTGKIKRILQYTEELEIAKNETGENRILISDETKAAYVKIGFEENGRDIEIMYSCPPRTKKKAASKENNPYKIFELFKRTIICDGQEIQNQEEFLQNLHLNDIEEFFDKCCFLSQDEHLHFLKTAKKSKAEALSFLFDIPQKWDEEQKKVGKFLNLLAGRRQKKECSYLVQLEQIENDLETDQKNLLEKIRKETVNEGISYLRLFRTKKIIWDQENVTFDEKIYKEALEEIENLIYFAEHKEECKNYLFNFPYQNYLKEFDGGDKISYNVYPLEYAYRFWGLIKQEEELEKRYQKERKYKKLSTDIQKRQYGSLNWEFIRSEDLLGASAISEIQGQLEVIKNLSKTQGILERVMGSFTQTRQQLIEHAHTVMQYKGISENVCPLCGESYIDKETLDQKIEEETRKLNELSDDSVAQIQNIKEKLYTDFFAKLSEDISMKLQTTVSEEIYQKLQEVKSNKLRVLEIEKLLADIGLDLPEEYQEDITETNRGYNCLLNELKENLKDVPEDVKLQLDDRKFTEKYKKYFDNDEEQFLAIPVEMLEQKIEYMKFIYDDINRKQLAEKSRELKKVRERKQKLEAIKIELENYQKILSDGIQEYKKKIIKDIEPLLYVYTARMLQQKFNGKSIFVDTDEEITKIQFVNSGTEDKQDILYSMSSGQLSAVALAFLLCMNQFYGKNEAGSVLLIDDPVQTIDDVNMVGFVDILRYEFTDRQIFVSTHEQKFEWFLRYRYAKAEKNVKVFNMKEIMLQN